MLSSATKLAASRTYIRRKFVGGVENLATVVSKCLTLLRKDFLKILVRGCRKFGERSSNHLRFEGWPATNPKTRLVPVAVEGDRITFDIFEVASQLFPDFFHAFLDHRSICPG